MKRLIIVGSPRSNGRSAHLAEMLFEACIDECPDDEVSLAPVSELDIAHCDGCDGCRNGDDHACVVDDDMTEIREIMDEADELVVVCPVYFSGAPAPMKALLDRCQPYFWTWERGGARRPMTLHIVGEGTNPNGYDALIDEVRSAFAVAGFSLERIVDWVGKIDETGEITSEGEEYVPQGREVKFARIDAADIENVHVIHEENLRQARKAKKKQAAAAKGAKERADAAGKQAGIAPAVQVIAGGAGQAGASRGATAGAATPAHGAKPSGGAREGSAARPQLNIHSVPKNQPKKGGAKGKQGKPSGGKGGRRG